MKYKGSIMIKKPNNEVAEAFLNPIYLKEYQDGFIKKETVKGNAGQAGAISKLYYKFGRKDMVLTETILLNDLPERFEAHYSHQHMDNTMSCQFVHLDDNTTRYEYEYEYTRINWVLPKLLAILFPGTYRKQGEKWIQQFKEFIEKQKLCGKKD